MLESALKEQLKGIFAGLEANFTFDISVSSSHENKTELLELLGDVADCSDHITCSVNEGEALKFTLLRNGDRTGITFRGIPNGHEFTSLLLAILNLDGKGKNFPDEAVCNRVKALKGPIHLVTYVSLTCTNCPDVVQALNAMTTLNPAITHEMVDGALYQDEVDALMQLLRNYMKTCLKTAARNNMCVRVIGDKTRLADDIKESIAALEEATKDYTGLHFQIALNYGSRDEITRAVRLLAQKVADGELTPDQITEESIAGQLDTAGIPDPDLMIRTSGEQRISNYLLWQLAYAEFYFTPVPWPDFGKEELEKAVEAYQKRDRRYGLVKEE